MRFYLNVPLVVGYVVMATLACLGVLQLAAARGGYAGLSLFAADGRQGKRIGGGLTILSLLCYAFFAPEILTPGPAGTEVAAIFSVCALLALGVTLLGADLRMSRASEWRGRQGGESLIAGDLPCTLYRPHASADESQPNTPAPSPGLVLYPDPTGFVTAPETLIDELCQQGITVLSVDAEAASTRDAPLLRHTLMGNASTALVRLANTSGIDTQRMGLVGLGLGGDVALRAATFDSGITAALAISPILLTPSKSDEIQSSLEWLHELPYRKVWRWKRNVETYRLAAQELRVETGARAAAVSVSVLVARKSVMATRTSLPVEKPLVAPTDMHFDILYDDHVRRLMNTWLEDKLVPHK